MTKPNQHGKYQWAVKYPDTEDSDFALFTYHGDADAFVTLMKLIDSRDYEIVEVADDAQTD